MRSLGSSSILGAPSRLSPVIRADLVAKQTRFCPNRRSVSGFRRSAWRTGTDQHGDCPHPSSPSTRAAIQSLRRSASPRPESAKHATAGSARRRRPERRRTTATATTPAPTTAAATNAATSTSAIVTTTRYERLRYSRSSSTALDVSLLSPRRNGRRTDRHERLLNSSATADTFSSASPSTPD